MEVGPAEFSACRDTICAVMGIRSPQERKLIKRVPKTKCWEWGLLLPGHAGAQPKVCVWPLLPCATIKPLVTLVSGWLFSSFGQC